jgi:PKD repeat protein
MKTINYIKKAIVPFLFIALLSTNSFAQNCSASFTFTVNGQTVSTTNTSTGTSQNTAYYWSFGDNTGYFTNQNEVHNYTYGGYYTICLSIIDSLASCYSYVCDSVYINGPMPPCIANFYYYDMGNQSVNFYNQSSNTTPNTTYSWSFGDNTSGSQQFTSHTYANGGSYTVCLYITDQTTNCYDSICQNVYVQGNSNCNANYTFTVNGQTLIVTDASTGTTVNTNYLWDFGDGNWSYNQNDSHTYQWGGTYLVCLDIYDSLNWCYDTYCQNITIQGPPQPCNAMFYIWQDSLNISNYWAWDASSGGTQPYSYSWCWGDNTPCDLTQYPSHTYTQPGLYPICLTITDANGCSSTYCDSLLAVRLQSAALSVPITVNVVNPLSVTENNSSFEFSLYPNPANEAIYFTGASSRYNYVIMNIVGSTVKSGISTNSSIEVGSLAQGTYIIQLTDDNGKTGTKRFIKK